MSGYPLLANRTTGNYAVATDRGGLWNRAGNQASAPVATKGRRVKAPPPIVHQIFVEYMARIEDVYWQSIFQNASIGKFPRGFSFQDNVLVYKQRSKLFRLPMGDIQNRDAPHIEIIEFFGRAGLRSSSDQERIRQEQEDRNAEDVIESMRWGSIRRARVKDILISGFVDELSQAMNLNRTQSIRLKTVIGLGFILNYFDSDSVLMVNGKIQAIEGIIYDAVTKTFDIDPSINPKKTKSKPKPKKGDTPNDENTTSPLIKQGVKVNFMAIWLKFLEALDRKRIDPLSQEDFPVVTDVSDVNESHSTDPEGDEY
jgi:hypothetical protein